MSRNEARSSTKGRVHRTVTDTNLATIRAWAASNGMTVSPRGRTKAEMLEAFRAADSLPVRG
ncbi:Lsr2 family DNA-binding protein [Trujillonella endophytica]|uniref:Lsr2 family DNA-binding protein n=1 Tax=Trujillonella endophytica TaxID=673521 RepID=UPI003D1769F5